MIHKTLNRIRFGFVSKASLVAVAAAFPMLLSGAASASGVYCNYDGNNGNGYCLRATGSTNTSRVVSCENPGNGCNISIGQALWDIDSAGSPGISEIYSPQYGHCIGDYGNDSSRADAAVDVCPSLGTAGWGTKMLASSCSNPLGAGFQFYVSHWNGFLGPQAWGDGQKEYLNKPTAYCFAES